MNLDRLSFQLYSARKFPPLEKQLSTLAELGFENVELYGGLFDDLAALKTGLAKHGLKAPSAHVSIERLRSDLEGFVREGKALGIVLAIVPFISTEERPKDAEGWKAFGRELQEIGARLEKEGFSLAWHNHDFEFEELPDGSIPLDRLFETAPDLCWEADIGWIERAGEDTAKWLEKYRGRIRAVHVKDLASAGRNADEDGWSDVGAGTVDWKRLKAALTAPSVELLVLEHDNPKDFEGFARRSRAAMAGW